MQMRHFAISLWNQHSTAAAAGPTGMMETDAELRRHKPVDNWIHTAVDVRK